MRSVEMEVYSLSELSDKAKKRAHHDYLNSGNIYFWDSDNMKTLEAFTKVFPITMDGRLTCEAEVTYLSGHRLSTYIWNNYRDALYKGRYYSKFTGAKKYKARHSKVQLEGHGGCPLTGYCIDIDILEPIFQFMEKPDKRTFEQLMKDCYRSWVKARDADNEHAESFEAFAEMSDCNNWEYTKDGKFHKES